MKIRHRLGRLHRNMMAPLHLQASVAELRRLITGSPATPDGWISITEQYKGKGWFVSIAAWQVRSEFERMVKLVHDAKPARIMEVGTAKGATLLPWCRIASQQVISVDLEGGIHGGGYLPIRKRLYQEFVFDRPNIRLDLFQEDSQIMATRQKVEAVLKGELLDVLFLDGDHSYQGVKKDFELWTPLVKSGGIILFHDIVPHTRVAHCEVDQLWNELKPKYKHLEFVEDAKQGWGGIGAIYQPQ